jgi:hypothetical protein
MTTALWVACIIAIVGWIGVLMRLIFSGGTEVATIKADIKSVKIDVKRVEDKTDDLSGQIGELLTNVGRLEGAVSRINGYSKGGH